MIVELRTYGFKPGGIETFLRLYRGGPSALQERILGNRTGYYATEVGELNRIVHLWSYASHKQRLERRSALVREPEWVTFLSEILPLIDFQHSAILTPIALPSL